MEQKLNKHEALHHKRLRSFQRAAISAAVAKQNAERSLSELDSAKLQVIRLLVDFTIVWVLRADFTASICVQIRHLDALFIVDVAALLPSSLNWMRNWQIFNAVERLRM